MGSLKQAHQAKRARKERIVPDESFLALFERGVSRK